MPAENHTPKPQLHNSDINLALSCPEKFRRKKILGDYEPMSTPLVLGRAQHHMAYLDLTEKIRSGSLLPGDAIKDLAVDTFRSQWDAGPLVLDEEERQQGLDLTKGKLTDVAVQVAALHHEQLAPLLSPVPGGLEWSWVLEAKNYPYDLAGQVDVLEIVEVELIRKARVRDLKILKKAPSQHEIEQSAQWTIYAMAVQAHHRIPVESVWLDALVKPTKTMGPRLFIRQSTRNDDDKQAFIARFEKVIEMIRTGLFMPTNPAEPWSPCRNCGYAETCRYYTRRPVTISQPIAIGEHNGKPKCKPKSPRVLIGPDSPEWSAATTG